MKMSWQGLSFCVMCVANKETIDHLFLWCLFSVHIWSQLAHLLKLNLSQLPQLRTFFGLLGDTCILIKCDRVLLDLTMAAIFWDLEGT